jgi:hypothetical protein
MITKEQVVKATAEIRHRREFFMLGLEYLSIALRQSRARRPTGGNSEAAVQAPRFFC